MASTTVRRTLWGFADLHTHPMAHLAFGERLLCGKPDGEPAQALGPCSFHYAPPLRSAIHFQLQRDFLNRFSQILIQGQSGDGFPHFRYWPHFSSTTHQQMWHEWVRRSHQAGLRVLVALAVNNELLGDVLKDKDSPPTDDRSTTLAQIQAMKSWVNRHSDFMEIVTSPQALRDCVSRGKLAIILGVEVDHLDRLDLSQLHRDGVRYLFPIHVTNNSYGGAAIYEKLFNLANPYRAESGRFFQIETSPDPLVTYQLKPPVPPLITSALRAAMRGNQNASDKFSNSPTHIIRDLILTPDPSPAHYHEHPPGHRNTQGLTQVGEKAILEMMKLGMILDMDHMSDRAVQRLIEIAKAVPLGYPLNSGHASFLAMGQGTEAARSDDQLLAIRDLGGLIGIETDYKRSSEPRHSFESVAKTQNLKRRTTSRVEASCNATTRTFAQHYLYALEKVGRVAFGTDANGLVVSPGPRFGPFATQGGNYCRDQDPNSRLKYSEERSQGLVKSSLGEKTWDFNTDGLAHYGLLPDFIEDLKVIGVTPSDLEPLFNGAENFAQMWEKTQRASELLSRKDRK